MGRKKIAIKKIKDEKKILVTFAKRKVGLFNKAYELSELCECKIAIIIVTNKDRMHMFTSDSMEKLVEHYTEHQGRGDLTTSRDIIKVLVSLCSYYVIVRFVQVIFVFLSLEVTSEI